jgi:hypothetical protein
MCTQNGESESMPAIRSAIHILHLTVLPVLYLVLPALTCEICAHQTRPLPARPPPARPDCSNALMTEARRSIPEPAVEHKFLLSSSGPSSGASLVQLHWRSIKRST